MNGSLTYLGWLFQWKMGRRHSGRPIYCFRDGNWLDACGDPITDAAKVTKRFRRIDYGHSEIEVTVDDPKANAAPKVKGKKWTQSGTDPVRGVEINNYQKEEE